MNRIASWCWVSLLLAPPAALHAADTPPSVNPFTLAERSGRMCLLAPEGNPFMMPGISHVGGALGRNAGEGPPAEKVVGSHIAAPRAVHDCVYPGGMPRPPLPGHACPRGLRPAQAGRLWACHPARRGATLNCEMR
jgi:hypothetical protein